VQELLAAARRLYVDSTLRSRMSTNGREYAERTFAIGPIADEFEAILAGR
jgi:hypothetical protein